MNDDLVTNAADEEQVFRAERKERDRARRRVANTRQQMSTADGREWVWTEHLEEGGLFEDALGSEEVVYRLLGRRSPVLKLIARLTDICPKEFGLMWAEGVARKKRDAEENVAARTPAATS